MPMRKLSLVALAFAAIAAAGALTAGPSLAQTAAPRPTGAAAALSGLDIKGFRSANFGATQAQVRAAIASDLPGARVEEGAVPAEGTYVISAAVSQLDPAPGSAVVTYVFGATSKTLFTINVVWTLAGEPTADQRQALSDAGARLVDYFKTQPAPAKSLPNAALTGPNGLLLYDVTDRKNSRIQVAVDGVSFQSSKPGEKPSMSPTPRGPATLRVIYAFNGDRPDVKAPAPIRPGSF